MIQKKWKTKDKILRNEDEQILGVFQETATDEDIAIATLAPQAFSAIEQFVSDVKEGKLKLKATFNNFERILETAEMQS